MSNIKNIKTKLSSKIIIFFAIFLIVIFILVASALAYDVVYKNKVYPGVIVGKYKVSGQTTDQINKALVTYKDLIDEEGFVFTTDNKKVIVSAIITSASDPDLNYRILTIDSQSTTNQAYSVGRTNSFFENTLNKLSAMLVGKKINLNYELDENELLAILKDNFSDQESPAKNASFDINDEGEVMVTSEKQGKTFNYQEALTALKISIENFTNSEIVLELKTDTPTVTAQEAEKKVGRVKEILALDPPTLIYEGRSWPLKQSQIVSWLEFENVNGQITLVNDKEKVYEYLESLSTEINQDPQDAKFKLEDGRVVEFQFSQDGLELDIEQAYARLNSYIQNGQALKIELPVRVKSAKVAMGDINDLGIVEEIGVGRSNFAGSPSNRRKNIAIGADSLDGILIAPGEEFSLMAALGPVDAEHNYLPELVIKGNRTIPEYGGGLCQIGTTSFRVALDAGLPITARRNHSYRVRYYEPAGTDATIYDPAPDFRFVNDTGSHILFTTQIVGNDLIFKFYGTSDGRKTEMTESVVYNVTSPGPTVLIETLDLSVGEKKCTEHAINGADAYFNRKITKADGEVIEERWDSHYVPWTEVCLIGVEELSVPECEEGDEECLKAAEEEAQNQEEENPTE
ncbi:VanW family protein [Patescibacteria group bacterium]|nr:VanW family protein [Patescibacteria group bacterium]